MRIDHVLGGGLLVVEFKQAILHLGPMVRIDVDQASNYTARDRPRQVGSLPSRDLDAEKTGLALLRVKPGQRSSVSGRHSAASATRIGYSATQENMKGAIRPAKSPPTMPPKDSAT